MLSIFQAKFYLTNRALSWLLKFLFVIFQFLGLYSTKLADLAKVMPHSIHQYNNQMLTLIPINVIERRAVCIQCELLYKFDDCIKRVGSETTVVCCRNTVFRKKCNQQLMKQIVTSSGNRNFYPLKVYCYTSLITSLQTLVRRTGFIEQCESTRACFSSQLSDVYDGTQWNDFLTVEGTPFLSKCNNYAFLLNIDWLQPYKHIEYSVGVIYLVILNLPRAIRFKRENVILFGVIPGPSEPSLTINTYLSPLVSDLQELWKGVHFRPAGEDTTAVFRCALLGVACDLPAARKSCGFLSHSANLGCSRCFEKFSHGFGRRNCYANFKREEWELRTNARHRADVNKILKCTTKREKERMELKLGCRYSVLLDLQYFRPIEMLLIDPMHNLFLGTAKHFVRKLWIGRGILSLNELEKIQVRLKNTIVPSGLGRIPVSINTGCFLTAEQWKNWTLYFSIYCLGDLLPQNQIECWRKFVLACRRVCKFSITNDDITVADALLLRFCKQATEIYGNDAVTPNMHMHGHLVSCLREFGPFHCYWLFPFERYNGILEGQPTNNRSIELQLMRRFQRDNVHLHLQHEAREWPNAEYFLDALPDPEYIISSPASFDQTIKPGPRSVIDSLSTERLPCLRKLYASMYPLFEQQFTEGQIYLPSTFHRFSSITWHGNCLTSTPSKKCFVYVTPPFPFTSNEFSEIDGRNRLAEIDYFFLHTISLPDTSEPKQHLFVCARWPMIHPKRHYFGKPVEVWCTSVYEPQPQNRFFLASAISSRVIISSDKLDGESVCIAISFVE